MAAHGWPRWPGSSLSSVPSSDRLDHSGVGVVMAVRAKDLGFQALLDFRVQVLRAKDPGFQALLDFRGQVLSDPTSERATESGESDDESGVGQAGYEALPLACKVQLNLLTIKMRLKTLPLLSDMQRRIIGDASEAHVSDDPISACNALARLYGRWDVRDTSSDTLRQLEDINAKFSRVRSALHMCPSL